jgi:hypothetical protein
LRDVHAGLAVHPSCSARLAFRGLFPSGNQLKNTHRRTSLTTDTDTITPVETRAKGSSATK